MSAWFEQPEGEVVVEVTDDGPGLSTSDLGTGNGLAGLATQLRERGETARLRPASRARVLTKLGVRDRVQVVVAAYESGLVRPRE